MKKQFKLFALFTVMIIILYSNIVLFSLSQKEVQYSPDELNISNISNFQKDILKGSSFLLVFITLSILVILIIVVIMFRIMNS